MHRFADISAVEGFLDELAARPAGALVAELPRQPGTRETRWMHLLSGAPVTRAAHDAAAPQATGDAVTVGEIAALRANVAQLRDELRAVQATVAKLCAELGIARP